MFGTHDLALFVVAGLLLNLTPGPDSLLIVTRSAAQGWRAGSAAALGIGTGTFVHVIAAAFGLSALLATSATAFAVVKLAGAAYLLYIGVALLRSRRGDPAPAPIATAAASGMPEQPLPWLRIYGQGFLTNVLNPKVALFFLAFVPQFIAPDAPDKALAFVVLGVIFNVNGMLWCHALALAAAFVGRRAAPSPRLAAALDRCVGAVFVALGVRLALAGRG